MKDTDFEKYSRAHSFWSEWQGAADGAPYFFDHSKGTHTFTFPHSSTRGKVLDSNGMPVGYAADSVEVKMAKFDQHIARGGQLTFTTNPKNRGVLGFVFDTSPPSDHTGNLIIDLT